MNCVCHDEPAYWQKDGRLRAGGFWLCAVAKRERARRVDAARRDVKNERQRERYDRDAVYRIEKRLHDDAWRRRQRLDRRRAAHVSEQGSAS